MLARCLSMSSHINSLRDDDRLPVDVYVYRTVCVCMSCMCVGERPGFSFKYRRTCQHTSLDSSRFGLMLAVPGDDSACTQLTITPHPSYHNMHVHLPLASLMRSQNCFPVTKPFSKNAI